MTSRHALNRWMEPSTPMRFRKLADSSAARRLDLNQMTLYSIPSTTSLYVPDVLCFVSVYHINMDRLSNIPTRRLIRHAIFSQTRLPSRVDYLAPLWAYRR